MSHVIPDNVLGDLFQAAGLKRFDDEGNEVELPANLLDQYWQYMRCLNRIAAGYPIGPETVAMIAKQAGYGVKSEQPKPASLVELWKNGTIVSGSKVRISWRNGKMDANLLGFASGDTEAVVDFEGKERRIPVEKLLELV